MSGMYYFYPCESDAVPFPKYSIFSGTGLTFIVSGIIIIMYDK